MKKPASIEAIRMRPTLKSTYLNFSSETLVSTRAAGVADNREDAIDVRVEQTLAQDALSEHASRSEENHFHLTASSFSRMRTPARMLRPAPAREALRFRPTLFAAIGMELLAPFGFDFNGVT